jgi:hypothetical protein
MKCKFVVCAALIAALGFAAPVRAALISGWGMETGFAGATVTEGAAGSFSTTVPSANAGVRSLITPMSLASVAHGVKLTGKVSFSNAPGNQQFRMGLFNTNGHAAGTLSSGVWTGADPNGWLGYMLQLGGGGGANDRDDTKGRNTTGAWLSNTGAYSIGVGPGNAISVPTGTTYDFKLRIVRLTATSVAVDYSFVGGSINRSGTYTDNSMTAGHPSGAMTSVNAIGFFLNGNTGSGTFSDVDITTPEPATAGMLGLALAFMGVLRRRRAS